MVRGLAGALAGLALAGGLGCAADAPRPEAPEAVERVRSAAPEYPEPAGAWAVHVEEFAELLDRARREGLFERGIGERVTGFGSYFLGLPYVAHTLELPGPEELVVNLKELDCVTLVENALALALLPPDGTYADFVAMLERIRYRGGELDGYASRLHYFSDWLRDAAGKGLVRDVTSELGGEPFRKEVHFMTSNRAAYPALRASDALVDSMRRVEAELNRATLYWIPQERIAAVEAQIREGDIIGITTVIEGLDISHTGLATWRDGRLHLLHAPDVGQPVEISAQPLAERTLANRRQTGVMVARPLAAAAPWTGS